MKSLIKNIMINFHCIACLTVGSAYGQVVDFEQKLRDNIEQIRDFFIDNPAIAETDFSEIDAQALIAMTYKVEIKLRDKALYSEHFNPTPAVAIQGADMIIYNTNVLDEIFKDSRRLFNLNMVMLLKLLPKNGFISSRLTFQSVGYLGQKLAYFVPRGADIGIDPKIIDNRICGEFSTWSRPFQVTNKETICATVEETDDSYSIQNLAPPLSLRARSDFPTPTFRSRAKIAQSICDLFTQGATRRGRKTVGSSKFFFISKGGWAGAYSARSRAVNVLTGLTCKKSLKQKR